MKLFETKLTTSILILFAITIQVMSIFEEKWYHGGKIQATESLSLDDQDDLSMIKLSSKKTYSKDQLQILLAAIPRGEITLLQASNLARSWASRIDNVNLTQGSQITNHINHMLGLIETALVLESSGFKIHLIESTGPDNIRSYKDIDLMASKEQVIYFIDYTNHDFGPENSNGLSIYSDHHANKWDQIASEKLDKLKNKSNFYHNSWVVRNCNIVLTEHSLIVPTDTSGPYGDTFDKALQYVRLAQQFTGSQIDELLDISSFRLEQEDVPNTYVRFNDMLSGIYDIGKSLVSLAHNNSSSMVYYKEVIEHIRTLPIEIQQEYSLSFHDKMLSGEVKPVTYVPFISHRKDHTEDLNMMERAARLRDLLISKGKKVPVLTMMLSLCIDLQIHPTASEYTIWSNHVSDPRWGQCYMNRVKSKQGLGSFVEMTVSSSYSNGENFIYGRGTSSGSVSTRNLRDVLRTEEIRFEEYESKLSKLSSELAELQDDNQYSAIMDNLINDSLHPTELGSFMKSLASDCLHNEKASGPLQWAMTYQMLCNSLTSMREKYKNYQPSVKTGIGHSRFLLYVAEIGDRNAMVFSTPSYTTDQINNCSCVIEGDLVTVDTEGIFVGKHFESTTRWFDVSHSNLDWGVLAYTKTLSYFSMLNDVTSAVLGARHPDIPSEDFTMGVALMMMNNTRFNQVSSQIRHIFNNVCGYSNGTSLLYDKLSWYTPNNFIERLYCLRMHKMSTILQMVKSNRDIGHAIRKLSSTTSTKDKGSIGLNRTSWMVAMPNTTRWLPSDQYLYSSFYTSYAFSNDRYNRVFSQAQVFNKQVRSRQAFVEYRKKPRDTDLYKLPWLTDSDDLFELMSDYLFQDQEGGSHKPCHLTAILGALNSLKQLHNLDPGTKLIDVLSPYELSNRMGTITLSSASNNRASVSERGVGGVLPIKQFSVAKPIAKNKMNMVTQTETQTIKSYEALLIKHHDYLKKTLPIPHINLTIPVSDIEYKNKPKLTPDILKYLQKGPSKVWPTIYYNMFHKACVVARMIHKDDNKPREIAIMNIFLRLLALNIEETARFIRDTENKLGDYTNLIENDSKDDYAATTHREYAKKKLLGKQVTNDNEDKSEWGPAQDPVTMMITLTMRQPNETDQNLIKLSFQNYTKKVFKIPDTLALSAKRPRNILYKDNEVTQAYKNMETLGEDIYNKTRQYLLACEGMFQGTLSVTSSNCAADCMRLSIEISKRMFKEYEYEATGHVTSDDSVHCKAYTKTNKKSKMYIVRRSLHVHLRVCMNFSYKRNMSCSVHTDYVFELNSIFYTSDGRIVPSIKSRLSYVTYHYELEFYQSALSIVNRSAEYVRKEGSIMGAYWVALLNTFNHILQFQLHGLYKEMGKKIFEVPLELGGLPTIDPLMSVSASPLSNIVRNYGMNFRNLLSFMSEVSPFSDEEIILTQEERESLRTKKEVPRTTRGSVTNLMIRDHKSKRIIRETAMSMPKDLFLDLILDRPSANKAIINCFTREGVYFSESSTALRFGMAQTPLNAKIYHVRSLYLNPGSLPRHSRLDIYNLARSFMVLDGNMMVEGRYLIPKDDYKYQVIEMTQQHEAYITQMQDYRIGVVQTISQSSYMSKVAETYISFDEIKRRVLTFSRDNRPVELGGKTSTHPIVYYEALNSYESRLKKAFMRIQKVNFSVTQQEIDESVAHKLLASNFIEGSRIIPSQTTHIHTEPPIQLYEQFDRYIKDFAGLEYVGGTLSLEDSIMRREVPRYLDITSLVHYKTTLGSYRWGGTLMGSQCYQRLKAAGKSRLRNSSNDEDTPKYTLYVVNRSVRPTSETIYSHAEVKVEQYPSVSDDHKIMSEINIKDCGKWIHYRSVWYGTYTRDDNTSSDTYYYKDVSDSGQLIVTLSEMAGVEMVMSNEFPLLCVDKQRKEMSRKLLFSQNDAVIVTEQVVRELFNSPDSQLGMIMGLSALMSDITIHTLDDRPRQTPDHVVEKKVETARQMFERNVERAREVMLNVESSDDEIPDEMYTETMIDLQREQRHLEMVEVPLDSSSEESSDYSDEESADTYGAEEFDNFAITEDFDEASQLSSAYSCSDNPLPHLAKYEGLIFDQGIKRLHAKEYVPILKSLRQKGIMAYRHGFIIMLPDDLPESLGDKSKLHNHENSILKVLELIKEAYGGNDGSIKFLWFKAYVRECIRKLPGSLEAIKQYLEVIQENDSINNTGEDDNVDLSQYEF